jgi:hypothetical protein
LIHFEFISVQGERQGSSFNLLHVDIQFSQHNLLEDAVFSPLWVLGSFVKYQLAKMHGFMSGSYILIHWSSCLFLCHFHAVFFLYSFIICSYIVKGISPPCLHLPLSATPLASR